MLSELESWREICFSLMSNPAAPRHVVPELPEVCEAALVLAAARCPVVATREPLLPVAGPYDTAHGMALAAQHAMQGNICERPGNWPAPRFLVRSNPAFLGIATIRLLLSAHCNCRNANSPGRTAASTCIRWPNRPAVPIARLRWGAKARPCEAVTGVKPEKDRKRESQARSRFTASLTHRVMIGRKACVVYPNRKLALIMPPFSETWPAVRLGKP